MQFSRSHIIMVNTQAFLLARFAGYTCRINVISVFLYQSKYFSKFKKILINNKSESLNISDENEILIRIKTGNLLHLLHIAY